MTYPTVLALSLLYLSLSLALSLSLSFTFSLELFFPRQISLITHVTSIICKSNGIFLYCNQDTSLLDPPIQQSGGLKAHTHTHRHFPSNNQMFNECENAYLRDER